MKQLYTHTPFWACRSIYLRTHPSIDLSTFVVVCTYPIALSVQLSSVHKAFAQGWPKTQPAGNPSEVPVTSHSSWAIWAWTLTWPSWRGHRSWTLWNPGSWSVWPVWIKVLSLNRRSSCQDLKLFACQSFFLIDKQEFQGFSRDAWIQTRSACFMEFGIWDFAKIPPIRVGGFPFHRQSQSPLQSADCLIVQTLSSGARDAVPDQVKDWGCYGKDASTRVFSWSLKILLQTLWRKRAYRGEY